MNPPTKIEIETNGGGLSKLAGPSMHAGQLVDDGPLRALLDSAHEAFVSMDSEGHVLVWNRMASETFGWSEQEARGRQLGDLIVPERYREAHEAGLRRLAATGEGRIVNRRIEIEGLHRDGHELPVELTISPMQTHAGVVFNAFLRDISDRREAKAGARRLAALVEGSEDAIVASDLDGTLTDWNPGAQRLYGYSAEEALGMSVSMLRPSGEGEEVEQLLAAFRADRRIPSYEARHQRKDGSSVDVSVSLSAVRDGSRSVIGVAAFIRDITERVEADRSLQEARKRFQTTFEEAPTGIGLVDPQGRWLSANSSLCRLVGRDVADLLITDFQSITHPDDRSADLAQMEATLAGSTAGYEMEKRFIRPDGSVVWAQLNRSLVRDDHGAPLYFITQLMDISERKEAEEELQRYGDHLTELARLDPLTGLRNFRDLHAMLDTETARSRRYDAHWSVVLLDVDGFREINASGGQVTGDRVLRQVAAAIEEASRASDLAARIGGDEFALLLPETSAEASKLTARRIAAAVAARTDGVSVSVGTASWPDDGESKELVLLRADMQLQAAKPLASSGANAAGGPSGSPGIRRILSLAREQLGMDVAYLAELTPDSQVVHAVSGDAGSFGVEEGSELPLEATYCQRLLEGRIPSAVRDTAEEPELSALPITAQAGVGSYLGVPLELSGGRVYGTLCCVSHSPNPSLVERHVELMGFLASLASDQIEREERELTDRRSHVELAGIHALLSALTARDHYTGEHSQTVVRLATGVARRLALTEDRVAEVEQVALLHDIGKVGVPDSVLQKRGSLNEQEWELMRQHPAIGARILADTETLSHLAAAVKAEHERFDGSGYPDGLRGEAIPLASRITLACDAYHAMTSDRPYRAALGPEIAAAELRAGAGTQFDPSVVGALLAQIEADAAGEPPPQPAREAGMAGLSANVLDALLPRMTPAWERRGGSDGASALGEVRAACRRCGTHVTATVSSATLSGVCGNCGSYELDLLES